MTILQLRMPLLRLHPPLRLHLLRSFTMSSTARTQEKIYKWIPEIENLEQYKPGGHCPVSIGDSIHDRRYHIIHKLGYGSFATIWLAQDQHVNRLVALKFLCADTPDNTTEGAILQHLQAGEHPFVLRLLDEFTVDSANGSHRCIVSEALGPSIAGIKYYSNTERLPGQFTRAVAAQCVQGLAHLHSCGVVHGDFHTGNILFRIPGLANWTTAEVYERFGTPVQRPIVRLDGTPATPTAPKYAVYPQDPDELLPFCSRAITLVDYGSASRGSQPKNAHTASAVAAPEILFPGATPIGMPADMWALGCTLYEIFGDNMLFRSFFYKRDEFVVEMVRMLGRFPDAWWGAWAARAEYCEDDGTLKPTPDNISGEPRRVCLKERVVGLVQGTDETDGRLDEQERVVLERMVEAMVRYEPADRATVADVVRMLPPNW